MSKRPAATTIGRTSPRQTRREYRVSAPPGGLGRDGSGGHCVATPEEGALSRGGCGDRHAPYIRAATHAEGIGGTHERTSGTQATSHVGECVVVVSVWCADHALCQPSTAKCPLYLIAQIVIKVWSLSTSAAREVRPGSSTSGDWASPFVVVRSSRCTIVSGYW